MNATGKTRITRAYNLQGFNAPRKQFRIATDKKKIYWIKSFDKRAFMYESSGAKQTGTVWIERSLEKKLNQGL